MFKNVPAIAFFWYLTFWSRSRASGGGGKNDTAVAPPHHVVIITTKCGEFLHECLGGAGMTDGQRDKTKTDRQDRQTDRADYNIPLFSFLSVRINIQKRVASWTCKKCSKNGYLFITYAISLNSTLYLSSSAYIIYNKLDGGSA